PAASFWTHGGRRLAAQEECRLLTGRRGAKDYGLRLTVNIRLSIAMTSFSARLLPAALIAGLAVAACSSDKSNPTPAQYEGLGSGSAGDPSVSRMGGDDSGTVFGIGKGNKDQGGGMGNGLGVNAFLW